MQLYKPILKGYIQLFYLKNFQKNFLNNFFFININIPKKAITSIVEFKLIPPKEIGKANIYINNNITDNNSILITLLI